MKYLITGCGISGLYSAYRLHKDHHIHDILLIEKNDHVGGRIRSLDIGPTLDNQTVKSKTIELGAGGVYENQPNILRLIEELGLSSELNFSPGVREHMELMMDYETMNYRIGKITDL